MRRVSCCSAKLHARLATLAVLSVLTFIVEAPPALALLPALAKTQGQKLAARSAPWALRRSRVAVTAESPLLNDGDVDWRKGPGVKYARTHDHRILALAIPAMAGALIDPV
eukprot:TRINITY_DN30011_c0_g1_i1.p1 TRINITY_DN30011_c0_g1~~TRINITY_DN30011_c0_g1_i1.p1  ORF type:complete len:127 (+),score=20.70 TRINITY_DN30011_c0_g1_i1:49-381(+)